jgi:guanylate kinase
MENKFVIVEVFLGIEPAENGEVKTFSRMLVLQLDPKVPTSSENIEYSVKLQFPTNIGFNIANEFNSFHDLETVCAEFFGENSFEKLNMNTNSTFTQKLQPEINKNHSRFIIVGPAASGKDFFRKKLESRGFVYGISTTTRPPRKGEIHGKDYFFISDEEFEQRDKNGEFYESVKFNGWSYGTLNKQFYRDDIFVMTPSGLSKVHEEDRKRSIVFYFDIPYKFRKERLEQRNDADTVARRLQADENDFRNFTDFDIHITTPNF